MGTPRPNRYLNRTGTTSSRFRSLDMAGSYECRARNRGAPYDFGIYSQRRRRVIIISRGTAHAKWGAVKQGNSGIFLLGWGHDLRGAAGGGA